MKLFKEQLSKKEVFDRLILNEEYAEAFAYAIDNKIEQEALRICINYVKEDDERTERERMERQTTKKHYVYFGVDPGKEKPEKEKAKSYRGQNNATVFINTNQLTPLEKYNLLVGDYIKSCQKRAEEKLLRRVSLALY